MRGSKRERAPGVWQLRVYVGKDPVTGKDRYRSKTFRGGIRAADNALRDFLAETEQERSPATEGTLGLLLDRWLELCERDLSPRTVARYREYATNELAPLRPVQLRKLDAERIDRLYAELATRLSARTVGHVHSVLRRACNQGRKWGWLQINPTWSASPPSVTRIEMRTPTPEEWRAIVQAADDPETQVFIALAAATGCRRGEIAGFQWRDFEDGTLTVRRAVIGVKDGVEVKDTKTHQVRKMRLDPQTWIVVTAWRQIVEDRVYSIGEEFDGDRYVFSRGLDHARPMHPDAISHRWQRLRRKAGVTTIRFQDLRHMHATELIRAGVDIPTVSRRLGHARVSTTLDVYAHASEASDDAAAEAIGRTLYGTTPELES